MSIVEVKNQAILINGKKQIDKAAILTIKLDSENMMTEYAEDEVILNEIQKISFKEYFGKEDFLLYFVALKNENNEILQMGFI